MGKTKIPPPAKLIIGLIYKPVRQWFGSQYSQSHKQNAVKDKVLDILKRRFGEIDFLSQELDFDYTDYYYPELGKPLKRIHLSFKRLLCEDKLIYIKLYTNKLEERFSRKQKRRINIDPGFLSLGKVILATTKNYSHRVYLGRGIFAEATLFYGTGKYKPLSHTTAKIAESHRRRRFSCKEATFRPWPWAYPDYQSKEYIAVFNAIRKLYQEQIKNVS
ncbi:MAG: hypothetical protein A3J51_04745 [Omnitrophica WOR_2 bacterium RIFCSPHIGHO2_02_FULL_45_21]|nr:MAG: hypothetical protein A3J51_04745 [Omnitrophica WOR_2 bacterium RIFCSPHIGHO2_02_FULL_45_21]